MLDLIVKLRIVHQSTVLFTGIEICALLHIAIFHQDQLCGFFKRRKNDFGWSSLNPFSEISFFEIIQMQVGKSVLLWRNASFQKHGNASLEISCEEVWANLLMRRRCSNFEIPTLPSIAVKLSLKIIRPAISEEMFDHLQLFS